MHELTPHLASALHGIQPIQDICSVIDCALSFHLYMKEIELTVSLWRPLKRENRGTSTTPYGNGAVQMHAAAAQVPLAADCTNVVVGSRLH
jgi:hypothetical protein